MDKGALVEAMDWQPKRWIWERWIGEQVMDQGALEGAMDGVSDRSEASGTSGINSVVV